MNEYFVAWWNVENLFSPENYSGRHEWLEKYLGKELRGWSKSVLATKISQLSSVIMRMNDNEGPDLLGVCEVENEDVLQQLVEAIDLPGRKYRVVHHNSDDKRGIDVAFIYDSKRFKTKSRRFFTTSFRNVRRHVICFRATSTRSRSTTC